MDTLVQENVNPIEKVEKSALIIASTIFNKHPEDLVHEAEISRVKQYSSSLFIEGAISIPQIEHAPNNNNNNVVLPEKQKLPNK